jgi:hypothetical protein
MSGCFVLAKIDYITWWTFFILFVQDVIVTIIRSNGYKDMSFSVSPSQIYYKVLLLK